MAELWNLNWRGFGNLQVQQGFAPEREVNKSRETRGRACLSGVASPSCRELIKPQEKSERPGDGDGDFKQEVRDGNELLQIRNI